MTDYRDMAIGYVEEGLLPAEELAVMCLKYMSQADVQDMLEANLFEIGEDE